MFKLILYNIGDVGTGDRRTQNVWALDAKALAESPVPPVGHVTMFVGLPIASAPAVSSDRT
jgi:hypothetical protein